MWKSVFLAEVNVIPRRTDCIFLVNFPPEGEGGLAGGKPKGGVTVKPLQGVTEVFVIVTHPFLF